MRKPLIIISSLIAAAALFWAGASYWWNLRGIGPALQSPPQDIARLLEPLRAHGLQSGTHQTG